MIRMFKPECQQFFAELFISIMHPNYFDNWTTLFLDLYLPKFLDLYLSEFLATSAKYVLSITV